MAKGLRQREGKKVKKFKRGNLTIEQKESSEGISQLAKNWPPKPGKET